jgi:hypothetical protein
MYQRDEADLPDGFDVLEESDEGDGEDHGDTVIAFVFASWSSDLDRRSISDSHQ